MSLGTVECEDKLQIQNEDILELLEDFPEMGQKMYNELDRLVGEVDGAFQENDLDKVREKAHELKGVVAHLGIEELVSPFQKVQYMDSMDAALVSGAVKQLRDALPTVKKLLEDASKAA